jgi:hypothetical protein
MSWVGSAVGERVPGKRVGVGSWIGFSGAGMQAPRARTRIDMRRIGVGFIGFGWGDLV